jgi:LmbE family N-acetylglucosaminyl deacetylase
MSVPDLGAARRLLCVQPHYDDNDIGAGGAIAALADAGAEVFYLTVTDDLVGVLDASLSDAEATARLRAEQHAAGAEVGVKEQYWLGYPDAGDYDYYDVRRDVIRHIRMLRPDVVFTVDPWLAYESHGDHLRTGRAVAEACMLHRFPRLRTDPEVDRAYAPHDIQAVAFYFTLRPNLRFDITATRERKHRALDAYQAQFTPQGLEFLHRGLEAKEREFAEGESFSHAEPLKVLRPGHLHCNMDTSIL